jgi:hypothetical protein
MNETNPTKFSLPLLGTAVSHPEKISEMGSFNVVPEEIILQIFSYSGVAAVPSISVVCHTWYRCANDQRSLLVAHNLRLQFPGVSAGKIRKILETMWNNNLIPPRVITGPTRPEPIKINFIAPNIGMHIISASTKTVYYLDKTGATNSIALESLDQQIEGMRIAENALFDPQNDESIKVLSPYSGGSITKLDVPKSETGAARQVKFLLPYMQGKRLFVRYPDKTTIIWDVVKGICQFWKCTDLDEKEITDIKIFENCLVVQSKRSSDRGLYTPSFSFCNLEKFDGDNTKPRIWDTNIELREGGMIKHYDFFEESLVVGVSVNAELHCYDVSNEKEKSKIGLPNIEPNDPIRMKHLSIIGKNRAILQVVRRDYTTYEWNYKSNVLTELPFPAVEAISIHSTGFHLVFVSASGIFVMNREQNAVVWKKEEFAPSTIEESLGKSTLLGIQIEEQGSHKIELYDFMPAEEETEESSATSKQD